MIKLEFPKVNLDAYPSAEEKIKVLKSQVDTLINELYIILDSIESGADSLLEQQTNSDGTVSFYPMDINASKTAVSFFEKAPTDDTGLFVNAKMEVKKDIGFVLNQTESSGTDYELIQALTNIGWEDLI